MSLLTPRLDKLEKNYLINGNFDYWQRINGSQLLLSTNKAYGADRWMGFPSVTNASSAQIQRTVSTNTGSQYDMTFGPWGVNKKMGAAQIIESNVTKALQGKTVTFSAFIKSTAAANHRIQLLAWTGTADSVTAFTNAVPYTEWSGYTLSSASFVSVAVLSRTAASNGYEKVTLTGTVPSNCNNLICVVAYADDAGVQNYLSQAQLTVGSGTPNDFSYFSRDVVGELAACQRYFQTISHGLSGQVFSSVNINMGCLFPVRMRTAPSNTWASAPTIVAPGRATYTAGSTAFAGFTPSASGFYLEMNNFAGLTTNDAVYWYSGGALLLDAEL